jgi:hypothetical protein
MKTIKKMGKNIGQELDRQAPILDGIHSDIDKATMKMNKVNGILKK